MRICVLFNTLIMIFELQANAGALEVRKQEVNSLTATETALNEAIDFYGIGQFTCAVETVLTLSNGKSYISKAHFKTVEDCEEAIDFVDFVQANLGKTWIENNPERTVESNDGSAEGRWTPWGWYVEYHHRRESYKIPPSCFTHEITLEISHSLGQPKEIVGGVAFNPLSA